MKSGNMGTNFDILMLDDAVEFIKHLPVGAKRKVFYNIERAKQMNDATIFKKLSGHDIWEFRTLFNGQAYRLFSFWDKHINSYVIVTHGIEKKTQKTPPKEIAKAENIMKQYYKEIYNEDY